MGGECAGLYRYETSAEITLLAGAYLSSATPVQWPVGTRTPIAGNTLASTVLHSGGPARMDSYDNVAGALAAQVRAIGIRAAVGVPVIVDGRVWGLATVGSARPGPCLPTPRAASAGSPNLSRVPWWPDIAMSRRAAPRETSQRPILIDSVLEGRAIDRWSLCEVAGQLRLPADGPFVVVAAEAPAVGIEALPEIESKLRGRDVYSVWRLHLMCRSGSCTSSLSDDLRDSRFGESADDDRVGVSARFDDLQDTPQALHFAKVMLRGRPHQASPVAVFDGSILATAAVSAPDVMAKLVGTVLDRL